jgi:hypothetical protein
LLNPPHFAATITEYLRMIACLSEKGHLRAAKSAANVVD